MKVYDSAGQLKITGVGGGGGLTNINVSAGTTSNNLSNLVFSNSNGLSFGLDASTITGSHNGLTSQSNQNVTAANGGFAFQTLSFSNANNFSFGTSAGSAITGSYTQPVVSNAIQSVGSATNSGTNTSRFAADDHVHAGVFSVGLSNIGNTAGDTRVDVGQFVFQGGNNITLSQITAANALNTIVVSGPAAGGAQTGISGIEVSNTTYTSGTVTFRNANGISFGSSGANGISASYTVPTQSNQTLGGYFVGNTTGQSSSSTWDARTLSIQGDGIVSAGWSNGSVRISATQSNQAFSADASSTFQTLTFQNSNGISFSNNAGAIRLTHDLMFSTSRPAFSAAGGSSTFQTLGFSDNSNVSFTNTNGSVGVASVRASLFAVSNTTQSSSGTQNLNAISFAGAGIASVGVTNGSVVVSVPAGGGGGDGGVFAGVSNQGNTAGSTGTVSTGNFVLVGSNGITLSQSTAGAGSHATVTILGNQFIRSGHNPYHDYLHVAGQAGQGTLALEPGYMPLFQCDRLMIPIINTNSSNSSGSHTISYWLGLYTRNNSSISLLTSTSTTMALTHSGTAGSYSLYSGLRLFSIPFTTTITEGTYWIGHISRTTSGGQNGSYSQLLLSQLNTNFLGHFSSSHNTTYQFTLGKGVYSATTSSMPNSIAFSQIRGSDSIGLRSPIVQFVSGTV